MTNATRRGLAPPILFLLGFAVGSLFQPITARAADSLPPELGASLEETLAVPVPTAPVELDGTTLFHVRGTTSFPATERARAIRKRLQAVARDATVRPDAVRTVEAERTTDIVAGDRFLMSVVDADARLESLERQELALSHARQIREAIEQYRLSRSAERLTRGAVSAGIATVAFVLAMWLGLQVSRRVERSIAARYKDRVQGVSIKSFEVIQGQRIWAVLSAAIRTLRVVAGLVLLFLYLEFVLSQFPWTRPVAVRLGAWALDPVVTLGRGVVAYLPNVVFLAILFVVIRYVLKVTRLFFNGVERGTVTIAGFDPEWAQPTYKIARVFVVGFALVIAYPYIPGSETPAFKGLSIFLGVLVSLGSSSAISNVVAGYTLVYRRAFKVGEVVKIEDVFGVVMEIRLLVTHFRTVKNEEVIVPNSKILNSDVINYSSLARTRGLILHTTVGIGYETPWRQVDAMLMLAADRTAGLLKDPVPFVRQKSLGDFAVVYELNAYCNNPLEMRALYSAMHQSILDVFNEYGVQIMTPAYEGDPAQPKVVPKEQWHLAPAQERPDHPPSREG